MKFNKLYALSSTGKIKTWEIEASQNLMIIRSGYLDGKISVQTKEIFGKNIGKINETTNEKQCELECESKWNKKIDEQYVDNIDKIKDYKEQEVLLPMLALDYHVRGKDISFPCYVQPKLNGVRCIYQNEKFISRKGKEYQYLDHLVSELKLLGIDVPDGEIYIHDMNFQEIIRRLKKERGTKTEELEYWIYDQINDDVFSKRYLGLQDKFSKYQFIKLKLVPTILVKTPQTIKELHDIWIKQGFEGAIIRNINGHYKVKHRSPDLQKYKEFKDEEFAIVGGHEGSGGEKGAIIFEVKNKDNRIFSVRPKGSREQRIEWFNNLYSLIGKKLTVRYQELSEENIPIFPVGIAIRDYE